MMSSDITLMLAVPIIVCQTGGKASMYNFPEQILQLLLVKSASDVQSTTIRQTVAHSADPA